MIDLCLKTKIIKHSGFTTMSKIIGCPKNVFWDTRTGIEMQKMNIVLTFISASKVTKSRDGWTYEGMNRGMDRHVD